MITRTASPVVAALLSLLCILFSPILQAGGRRRAVALPPPTSALSLTFVEAGRAETAILDAGTISWRGGRKRSSVTTRAFGVRIGPPSREPRGTATLRAFLESSDPRATIRIDGVVLGTTPRVIRHHAPIGITLTHRLEIEVPVTAPDGALDAAIGWEVTTE